MDRGINDETARQAVRAYYAMVHFVDEQVGRLLQALRETGLIDNTLIVYTSDHGEMLGRRGLWYKNQLLERSIRVPLLIHNPRSARRGAVEDRLVSLLDLFPTLAEVGGAEPWPEAAGNSLCPLIDGRAPATFDDRPIFTEYADWGIGQPAACIRRRNLKLLAARTYEPVLYDLNLDPGETTDRSKDSAYRDALVQLQKDLQKHWDPDVTYQRVVRNQKRIDLVRQSRANALARGQKLSGGVTA
jgi:choline-sulfatase